jgi:hypothetical protein
MGEELLIIQKELNGFNDTNENGANYGNPLILSFKL